MRPRVIALAVVALAAAGFTVVLAATRRPDFVLGARPAKRVIAPGAVARFRVTVRRTHGFRSRVRLTVRGLPRGSRAKWRGTQLAVRVSRSVRARAYRLVVSGASGRRRHRLRLTLVVRRPPPFTLRVTPATLTLLNGETATYSIRVVRARGFRARVSLGLTGAPPRSSTHITPRNFSVTTASATPRGSYRLTLTGAAPVRGGRAIQRAQVLLVTDPGRPFGITGRASAPLSPGRSAPLALTFTNPNPFPLRVRRLEATVRSATTRPGCDGKRNFFVTAAPMPTPLVIAPGTSKLATSPLAVGMTDLGSNQDACQGAGVALDLTGTATR